MPRKQGWWSKRQEAPVEEAPKHDPNANLTADSVYDFYKENLMPAIWTSLPLLLDRVGRDLRHFLQLPFQTAVNVLLPWTRAEHEWSAPKNIANLWDQTLANSSNNSFTEFMLRQFDTDQDGHISATELMKMKELLPSLMRETPHSWISWFNRTWPLMDWKVGVFLWRSCGGLLLLLVAATIVPGRLHGISGRILRWPILGITYFMITTELIVYTAIRLFTRLVETVFANSRHRTLRRRMANAKSYEEWYELAHVLDVSQGRDQWRREINDGTAYRYNWSFITELMSDMRLAREKNDSIMGLAILQQCTRKNVGGVMAEEQFCYTNTGEPKYIVEEFLEEVVKTLKFVTDEAKKIPLEKKGPPIPSRSTMEEGEGTTEREATTEDIDKQTYQQRLKRKADEERLKMFIFPEELANEKTDALLNDGRSRPSLSPTPSFHGTNDGQLPSFHRENVINFLKRARAAYGRTALCLGGGAMMGNYHFGHVKALLETDNLPHIISGTSAGSAIGAMICTRTDAELERDMRPEILCTKMQCFSRPWLERFKSVYYNGCLFDSEQWLDMLKWFTCGDMTFAEAYKKTGRVLCITLSAIEKKSPPVLINYISAPNVVIASAILASAAVPGFVQPIRLQIKDADGRISFQGANKDQLYWDGSIEQDIPTSGLGEMLNCQFFVAAQCNPHIVPFFYNSKGGVGQPSRWSSGMREDSWRGGFLLSALELYLKSDMRTKLRFLNDLEAGVGFTSTLWTQEYEGTTTIVPHVTFIDYFKLFSNPTFNDMVRYFQGGSVAAYQHCAIIKLHYKIVHAFEECLDILEGNGSKPRRKSRVLKNSREVKLNDESADSINITAAVLRSVQSTGSMSVGEDEHEAGGFDGVEMTFARKKR